MFNGWDKEVPNSCGCFKDGVLRACNEVCGKMMARETKDIHGGQIKI